MLATEGKGIGVQRTRVLLLLLFAVPLPPSTRALENGGLIDSNTTVQPVCSREIFLGRQACALQCR